MARYKPIHNGFKLLPVDFDQQVIPGSFEHARCHLVDHEIDLWDFHARQIAASVGMTIDPDLCILNYYDAEGRMGLHRLTLRQYDVTPDPPQ